jgi:hypothetical protein
MADRRLIAQSITNSGQVAQLVRRCGPWGATFFTWLLTFIDDDSRFEGDPDTLLHKVLGRYVDQVSTDQVTEMVALMNDIDLAVWYEVVGSPGERYLYFPRFTLHQTLREDRYGPSRLPAPPNWVPEEGHPYAKNARRKGEWKPGQPTVHDLRSEKPQRDLRKTVRVPRRPVNKGDRTLWETAAQPSGATSAPAAQPHGDQQVTAPRPSGHLAGTEDTSPLAPPPHVSEDSSRPASAQRAGTAATAAGATGPRTDQAEAIVEGATGLWRTALELLRDRAIEDQHLMAFVTWYAGTRLEQRGQTYYVVAPNEYARDWLSGHYEGDIRATIGALIGEIAPDVRVVLEAGVPALPVMQATTTAEASS